MKIIFIGELNVQESSKKIEACILPTKFQSKTAFCIINQPFPHPFDGNDLCTTALFPGETVSVFHHFKVSEALVFHEPLPRLAASYHNGDPVNQVVPESFLI